MLTIAFEGAGGAMLILAAIILAVPSHWSDKVCWQDRAAGAASAVIGIGLCFLAFGRIMGWPV